MGELLIPEYVNGVPTWIPQAADIQRLLKEGDPTIGWEGDPRLYVQPREGAEGYAVGRLCEDGVHRLICLSRPPHKLDKGLLIRLRDHDSRRVDIFKKVDDANKQAQKEKDARAVDRIGDAYERVVHGLSRDVGHLY